MWVVAFYSHPGVIDSDTQTSLHFPSSGTTGMCYCVGIEDQHSGYQAYAAYSQPPLPKKEQIK